MKQESEELPSGKLIMRTFGESGELIKELHSYGGIEIACWMEFAAGKKVAESYIVRKRMVGRARYEKARVEYPDMPAADRSLDDVGAEFVRLARIERRQKAEANRWRRANPLTEEQKQEAQRQIPFFQAAGGADMAALRQLLDEGEDPNCVAIGSGHTPLYNACFGGSFAPEESLAAVCLLLERGADPNKRFDYDSPIDGRLERELTALMIAGTVEVAEALLNAGAEVNVADARGVTPLMRAAARGLVDVVQLLLQSGADVEARSNDGRLAADFARDKMDFFVKNGSGFKPGHAETRVKQFREVLRLLGAEA